MASAIICLATNQRFYFSKYIFDNIVKNLEGGVKFLIYPRFVQEFLDKQVKGMSNHKKIYVTPSHTKKVFANMKRQGKDFSSRDTPLFQTMMVQAQEEGEGSIMPTCLLFPNTHPPYQYNYHHTPPFVQKFLGRPEPESLRCVSYHILKGFNPLLKITCSCLNGVDEDLMNLAKVYDLPYDAYYVGRSAQAVSSKDEGLGAHEDASKQERKIADLDVNAEVTLVDEAQGRNDDYLMFDTGVLDEQEVDVTFRIF
ncbi:hypothetical protein Tco_0556803 [Tanacetum coccineum]